MTSRVRLAVLAATILLAAGSVPCAGVEPVNPELIPEGRAILDYFESIYREKCLIGQNKYDHAEKAHEITGKYPALVSADLSGWSEQRWDERYRRTLQSAVDRAKDWYREKGGIVSFEWHWANPLSEAGTFQATRPKFMPIDVGNVVTAGTDEHATAMEDMRKHADYLEQLRDARVPVLWRPLHEIEGGWFWWSDTETPENTAALWRMMFDYLVKERELDNLIWVYSSALKAGDHGKDVEAIEYRKRFYPGDAYVDIAGIDIYVNSWFGWPDFRESAYPKAWEIIDRIAPDKMHALCECQGIPNPDMMAEDGPVWLYALPWYVGDNQKWNPPDWVEQVYPHDILLTLDELPEWENARQAVEPRRTMYVDGRFLYDRCGERVVLRGCNAMIIYWDRRGKETYPEIARTGANCCRIFWKVEPGASPQDLDATITNCRDEKMIPMVCVWDATGKWENFAKCVDYWCRPEVVEVLQKHEDCLLVNIANEAGKGDVTHEQYRKAYAKAVARMREAGLRMPLVIDAANWGRGEEYILENAEYLIEQDPDRNLLFSWHPWDTNQPQDRYRDAIDGSIAKNICMIIGEFSHFGVFFKKAIDYQFIMKYCHEKQIGWLPWVWWCGKEGSHDGHSITTDKQFGHWANPPWGEDVAVRSPYSIKNTSRRSHYLEHGTCRDSNGGRQ